MKVRLTEGAEADLEKIGDRIAETDSTAAELTVRAVRAAARLIAERPATGSPVIGRAGIRKRRFKPYVILYAVSQFEILIVRIAHERSDWVSLV